MREDASVAPKHATEPKTDAQTPEAAQVTGQVLGVPGIRAKASKRMIGLVFNCLALTVMTVSICSPRVVQAFTSDDTYHSDDRYSDRYSDTYYYSSSCRAPEDEIGDGRCDYYNNTPECGYDGGDCCQCTCDSPNCGIYTSSFDCEDPTANCSEPTPTPTAAPVDCTWLRDAETRPPASSTPSGSSSCEPAIIMWGNQDHGSPACPRILPVNELADLVDMAGYESVGYGCKMLTYEATVDSGLVYGFNACLDCRVANASDKSSKEFSAGSVYVPTLDPEEDVGYGPGDMLVNQTFWYGTRCFVQADTEVADQYDVESSVCGGTGFNCCDITEDVIVSLLDMHLSLQLGAGAAAVFLVAWVIFRALFRCVVACGQSFCCCVQPCCAQAQRQVKGKTFLQMSKFATTVSRIAAIALEFLGFGLNIFVTASYFRSRTVACGLAYEIIVGVVEALSAWWTHDTRPLHTTKRTPSGIDSANAEANVQVDIQYVDMYGKPCGPSSMQVAEQEKMERKNLEVSNKKRLALVIVCFLPLALYVIFAGIDQYERQDCGDRLMFYFMIEGVGLFLGVGIIASLIGRSPGYFQQVCTDLVAAYPAFASSFCQSSIERLEPLWTLLAILLIWSGTALVEAFGETAVPHIS